MSESPYEPFLLVEKCGSNRGRPVYIITKHWPQGREPDRTRDIRCMDLDAEALTHRRDESDAGCTYIQFFNDGSYLRCTNCGKEFPKYWLGNSARIEVRGIPH